MRQITALLFNVFPCHSIFLLKELVTLLVALVFVVLDLLLAFVSRLLEMIPRLLHLCLGALLRYFHTIHVMQAVLHLFLVTRLYCLVLLLAHVR